MQTFLRKAFGIYSGEGLKSLRFVRFAIFWALGIATIETLSDGLFLEKVGAESLPIVYLIIALAMIGVSSLVIYSLRLTSPYRILTTALTAGIILSLVAGCILLGSPPTWFWFSYKISSRMLFMLLIATSWTFIDQYHDLQDAKRVFPLYSSAYFFGSICSGVLINNALPKLGFPTLLAIASLSLFLALVEAIRIAQKIPAAEDDSTEGIFSSDRSGFISMIQLIFRSPFTIFLLLLSLSVQLLLIVSEFNYMDTFGELFPPGNEGSIAEFLGKCRAWIMACNILVGIFCYSRFVRRLGLHNIILITPLFFLLVYAQWITHNTLFVAILGLIAVDGVLFTFEDTGFNLLTNAVPSKLKSKVRIINDSFFEPIGILLSALLLFCIQSNGSRWLGLILTLLTVAITLCLRTLYSKAILINLKDNVLHFGRTLKDWLRQNDQKDARKEILSALHSPCEEVRLLACESLLILEDTNSLPQILNISNSFSTVSRIRLLFLFETSAFASDVTVLNTITSWISTCESPELSKWVHFYLAKIGKAIHRIDASDDLLSRGAAILTMNNRANAEKKMNLMLRSQHIDEIGMALDLLTDMQQAIPKAIPFLTHESILVKRAAARCIARLVDENSSKYAPQLIKVLSLVRDNTCRLLCLDALGKISDATTVQELLIASIHFRPNERRKTEVIIAEMGLKIVPTLLTLAKDISISERARILAVKILGRQAAPQLQPILLELITTEIDRAYFYFYYGHILAKQHLQDALLTGFRSVIDFIIHLLGAAGSIEDPELLLRAVFSRNAKTQSHAIESLEKTCNPRLFARIRPLIDDLPLEERIKGLLRHKKDLPKLSLADLFSKLEQSLSPYDQVIALHLKPMTTNI